MPLRGYTTDRRPPSVLDHILAHPFEMGLAAWGGGAGALLVIASIWDEMRVSPTVDMLPDWLAATLGGLLIVGGLLQTWGLLDDSDDIAVGWKLERMGLILSGAAWASYTMTIMWMLPRAVLSWSLTGTVLVMLALRYAATVLEERRIRKAIEPS